MHSKSHDNKYTIFNDGKDLKITADIQVHDFILNNLRSTGIPILSEESVTKNIVDGYCWIVDPIDGTLNYFRGFQMACISIALWNQMQPVFGVINDIFHKSIYKGIVGKKPIAMIGPFVLLLLLKLVMQLSAQVFLVGEISQITPSTIL